MLTTAAPPRCATEVLIGPGAVNGHSSSEVSAFLAGTVPIRAAVANPQHSTARSATVRLG